MTESQFVSTMNIAKALERAETDPIKSSYWHGYQRGIRRNWHGDKFGTQAEHEQFLAAMGSGDEMRRALGLGYRDGLAYASPEVWS